MRSDLGTLLSPCCLLHSFHALSHFSSLSRCSCNQAIASSFAPVVLASAVAANAPVLPAELVLLSTPVMSAVPALPSSPMFLAAPATDPTPPSAPADPHHLSKAELSPLCSSSLVSSSSVRFLDGRSARFLSPLAPLAAPLPPETSLLSLPLPRAFAPPPLPAPVSMLPFELPFERPFELPFASHAPKPPFSHTSPAPEPACHQADWGASQPLLDQFQSCHAPVALPPFAQPQPLEPDQSQLSCHLPLPLLLPPAQAGACVAGQSEKGALPLPLPLPLPPNGSCKTLKCICTTASGGTR
mmetsp:Transcript_103577/g.221537  ORF Transcript_103577/g.221537 Transcript_103577/m.221537 type:complete len:299 (-) Transcript_103577:525-1421(-)